MNGNDFTDEDISKGFKQIEGRLTRLSILLEIARPYYVKYDFVRSHPLVWMINESMFHVIGQIARCWFDKAKGGFKTISVRELYEQIRRNKKYQGLQSIEKQSFDALGKEIEKYGKKYEKEISTLADKYYAHIEVRTEEEVKREYEDLKIGWKEIEDLIVSAKRVVNEMVKFWEEREANFEMGSYWIFRDQFWNSIKDEILVIKQPPLDK